MLGEPLPESNLSVAEESVRNRSRSVTVFGAGHNLCFRIGCAIQQKAPAVERRQGLMWGGGEGGIRTRVQRLSTTRNPGDHVKSSIRQPEGCVTA